MNRRTNVPTLAPRTWWGWLVTVIVGLALLVAAVLFMVAALVAGMLIAAFLAARALWFLRKADKERSRAFLQAEYKVEREETTRLEDRTSGRDVKRNL